jgi:hypothetical protein
MAPNPAFGISGGFLVTQRVSAFVLLTLLAAACSSGKEMAAAERGVDRFRELMAADQFAQIYTEASEDFRKSGTQEDLTKFFEALNRKLGRVKKTEKTGWHVDFSTSGTFVTLSYKTDFEKGVGSEQFIFHVAGGDPTLRRYDINSPALLTD